MTIEFLGAARTVTGSMHLVTTERGNRILLDCGLFQGRREEARRINSHLPFDPREIDAVVVSHAHIDHIGNLPSLVSERYKGAFRGDVFATHATRDLCSISLPDAARIQQADADYLRRHHKQFVQPIYTTDDAFDIVERFASFPYHKEFAVTDDVTCTFYDAGHILGSALVVLTIKERGGDIRLCFTGDLGRPHRPILRAPEPVGDVDYLISESTYGGRRHEDYVDLQQKLKEMIELALERGGKLLIPAFAIERTQDIIYLLNDLFEKGELPRIPIFVDSPLATNATDIYRCHPECFNAEVATLLQTDPDPFGFSTLRYVQSVSESKALNDRPGPAVIIAASGMMEAGRILHHLMHGIEDERNIILVVGYQAEHTLGRRIVERQEEVNIMGSRFKLKADVKVINGLSAHADHQELVSYIGGFSRERMKRIFLVHGEQAGAEALRTSLGEIGFADVRIPERGEKVEM